MHLFTKSLVALAILASVTAAGPALAEGNLAANGAAIEIKIDTTNNTFTPNEIQLETGKYYRLNIIADDGAEDLAVMAPEFFRNVWINQIVVDDLEIKVQNPYSLEFDGAGTFNVSFVPIRPGVYEFYSPGQEDKGLKGTFVVK